MHEVKRPPIFIGEHDIMAVVILILMLGMNLGIKGYFKSRREQQQQKELEKKNLEQHATLSLMTRVVYDLNDMPGYRRGETPICFIGAPDLDRQMPGFETYYRFTGSWSGSAIASDNYEYFYHPYRVYIQYYLNEPVTFCSIEEYNALKADPKVAAMPAYPAEGSMGFVNGVLVIKMQSTP